MKQDANEIPKSLSGTLKLSNPAVKEETKHTPGPWFIDEFAQIHSENAVLGRVYCGDIFPNDDLPECTANARLIASAPTLAKENQELKARIEELENEIKVLQQFDER